MNPSRIVAVVALLLVTTVAAQGADWPTWRGPNYDGSAPDTKNLPASFGNKENLRWATTMPGPSGSTPIVIGDAILIASLDNSTRESVALCLNRADGKQRWKKVLGPVPTLNDRNDMVSCSPVTDGKLAIFLNGVGDLAAFTLSGEEVWRRNIQKDYGSGGKFNVNWGYAASPTLHGGKLYIPVIQRNVPPNRRGATGGPPGSTAESFILCLNPQTGRELWRQVRPSDARSESMESYSTLIPIIADGKTQLVIEGGDATTAHDAETGKELWRYAGWNPGKAGDWRLIPSITPNPRDGLVYMIVPRAGPVIPLKAAAAGDVSSTTPAWKLSQNSSDVGTSLLYNDRLYVLDGIVGPKHVMTCLDPRSGAVKWTGELGGARLWSSPTGADGKIYCMHEDGAVTVVAADDGAFKVLARNKDFESSIPARSSVVAADDVLWVRTADKLYCIAKSE